MNRALGVENDSIGFKEKFDEKPQAKRGIVSTISAIYDPLGLISPVTLQAKAMVQRLCRLKIGWDDEIPEDLKQEWQSWQKTLSFIENISLRRCFIPNHFEDIKSIQLHIFSDGSEMGYGACAYLRVVDVEDNVDVSLVLVKSRLAPIKQQSIPCLELSGAVVACRLYRTIAEELEVPFTQTYFGQILQLFWGI